jgi:hypothetical protein
MRSNQTLSRSILILSLSSTIEYFSWSAHYIFIFHFHMHFSCPSCMLNLSGLWPPTWRTRSVFMWSMSWWRNVVVLTVFLMWKLSYCSLTNTYTFLNNGNTLEYSIFLRHHKYLHVTQSGEVYIHVEIIDGLVDSRSVNDLPLFSG